MGCAHCAALHSNGRRCGTQRELTNKGIFGIWKHDNCDLLTVGVKSISGSRVMCVQVGQRGQRGTPRGGTGI